MTILFPHRQRILLVAAFLAFDLICSSKGSAQTLKSHECFQNFSGALARVKDGIPRRFGQAWKMESLPPAIASELEWITNATGELQGKSEKLDSRAGSLHMDESAWESSAKWQKTRSETLEGKQKDFNQRWQAFEREVAVHQEFVQRHNANRCTAPEDTYASVCGAYDEEARRGNEEGAQLDRRKTGFVREQEEIKKQGEDLFNEAAQLASRLRVLDQTKESLDADVSNYMESCGEAAQRARALAEILDNRPSVEHLPDKSPDPTEEVLKAYGKETVTQTYEHFVEPLLKSALKGTSWAGLKAATKFAIKDGPGIALIALDIADAGMDERGRQVANNTFLMGEYGKALERLRKQGTIRAGEPGYEALREMQEKLVKDAPTSPAEFTWQTLSSRKVLTDGVAAAVGKYVSETAKPLGNALLKRLSPEDKQFWGKKIQTVWKPLLSSVIGGGSGITAEAFLKNIPEAVHEQRQKSTERKAKTQ
jgi:hypothetical protein